MDNSFSTGNKIAATLTRVVASNEQEQKMRLYKLTNREGKTENNFEWVVGRTHVLNEQRDNPKLCSSDVLHAYTSPYLAVLMNPIHANFINPRCFIVEGEVVVSDGLKVGSFSLTVKKEIKLPVINTTQKIAFGIYCALAVYKEKKFKIWASNWLKGIDRDQKGAAADSADYAADYAAASADYAADAAIAAAYAITATTIFINFHKLALKAMKVK